MRDRSACRDGAGTTEKAEVASDEQPALPGLKARLWKTGVAALVSGCGGFLAIYLLAHATLTLDMLLLIAPFGSSCVLLFALPQSPLAQPRNVVGGHLISSFVGVAVLALVGSGPLSMGLSVGLAIAAMQVTGTLHPPAGGDPLVVTAAGAGWSFLLTPVLAGSVALVLAAYAYHRLVSKREYAADLAHSLRRQHRKS